MKTPTIPTPTANGYAVESAHGQACFMLGAGYNCPALGLRGYRDWPGLKRAIGRKLADRAKRIAHWLNGEIATRNLYRDLPAGGSVRYVSAMADGIAVTVASLDTGERIAFVGDGSFRDGNGRPVRVPYSVAK